MAQVTAVRGPVRFWEKPGPWVDLGLTLPIFLLYQLGVVFLRIRNATDIVTGQLLHIAEGNLAIYVGITLAIGIVFAGIFFVLGRGQAFRPTKFVQIAVEGLVYAIVMRFVGSYVVGSIFAAANPIKNSGPFTGLIMSFGAGFYEELAFRVILFGLGAKALVWIFAKQKVGVVATTRSHLTLRSLLIMVGWGLLCAAFFSLVHYKIISSLGDDFELTSFTFRMVLGVVLTLIYVTRGFAAAVWAHALYDVWVLVF